jgi:hypothetical protein
MNASSCPGGEQVLERRLGKFPGFTAGGTDGFVAALGEMAPAVGAFPLLDPG